MNRIKIFAVSMLLLSLFLTACDKEEVLTNEDILTNNGWVVTSLIFTDEDGIYDATPDMEACDLDDILFFEGENNQFKKDQGPTKCYEEQEQLEILGIWAIIANGTVLVLGLEDEEALNMKIQEISKNRIKLYWEDSSEDDVLEAYTMTLQPAN